MIQPIFDDWCIYVEEKESRNSNSMQIILSVQLFNDESRKPRSLFQ